MDELKIFNILSNDNAEMDLAESIMALLKTIIIIETGD